MLTANNARKLVDDYNRQQLEKIHDKIKKHAESTYFIFLWYNYIRN
jgi:hypothetical protein